VDGSLSMSKIAGLVILELQLMVVDAFVLRGSIPWPCFTPLGALLERIV
jgi:hypothetical protein